MNISVKKVLGNTINVEDAIVLRDYINETQDESVELDFSGIDRIPTTFLSCLFTDIINKEGRDSVINRIGVKNLSNYTDYSRVVRGTTFC
ncbi:MAG: STAS-like domain-containing protein [Clostridium perfringens]|nr:STAS-like domain-containing protein [Clostridium perfringens]